MEQIEKTDQERPNTVASYLQAIITKSKMFDTSYMKIAERHGGNAALLTELFVCALDKVDANLLKIAEQTNDPVESFRKCRFDAYETRVLKPYKEELKSIGNDIAFVTKEVRALSGKVDDISSTLPQLEEMFHQTTPLEDQVTENIEENNTKQTKLSEGKETIPEEAPTTETIKEEQKETVNEIMQREESTGISSRKMGVREKVLSFFRSGFDNIPGYIETLYQEGYTDEQVDFVLSCFKEGYTKQEINRFVSKKIPVDKMKKLKELYNKRR